MFLRILTAHCSTLYKKLSITSGGGGVRLSSLLGKNSKLGRGEGIIQAVGKNITWKNGNLGSDILFPLISRLFGRLSNGEEGPGRVP